MEDIELFDRYIDGSLSPEETKKFDRRLETDSDFLSDFKAYCAIELAIYQEAEQDNKDFGEAMKRIPQEELSAIVEPHNKFEGFKNRLHPVAASKVRAQIVDSRAQIAVSEKSQPRSFRKWLWIQSIGVAALIGIGVIYVVIVRNETDITRRDALAMSQQSQLLAKAEMDKVDNLIYTNSPYAQSSVSRSAGDMDEEQDISVLSDEQLKARLPELEDNYGSQDVDVEIADTGSELVMAYVRLHERDKAKALLTELITRFQGNEEFNTDVENWQTTLDLLK